MTHIPTLETTRLVLRGFRLDDLDAMVDMWQMPDVVRYIGGAPLTREQSWVRLARHIGMWGLMGFGFWAIVEKASGLLVGEAGFHEMRRGLTPDIEGTLEAGWGLLPAVQGRGYADEALTAMLAWAGTAHPGKAITCIIDPRNAASLGLARKHGFRAVAETTYQGSGITVLWRGQS